MKRIFVVIAGVVLLLGAGCSDDDGAPDACGPDTCNEGVGGGTCDDSTGGGGVYVQRGLSRREV